MTRKGCSSCEYTGFAAFSIPCACTDRKTTSIRVSREDFDYSATKIAEAQDTWAHYNGFSGETCHSCKLTANVLGCGAGWFCVCGDYNAQSWTMNQMPHEKPDLGPTQATIRAGHSMSKTWQEYEKKHEAVC